MFFLADEFFTDAYVMEVSTQALYLILLLSAPMLMAALSVGLVISVLQATTQVQEQTLSFVPKLIATFLSCVICGTWISSMVGGFATRIFTDIAQMGPRPYFDRNYNKRKAERDKMLIKPESYLQRGWITQRVMEAPVTLSCTPRRPTCCVAHTAAVLICNQQTPLLAASTPCISTIWTHNPAVPGTSITLTELQGPAA